MNSENPEIAHEEFVMLTHDHLNKYIKLANQKASILLTAQLAFLGLVGGSLTKIWQQTSQGTKFIIILTVISTVLATFFAARTIYPNTPKTKQGLILWDSIVDKGKNRYREAVEESSREDLHKELLDENFQLSKVAKSKYTQLRRSILATGGMVIGAILSGVIWLI